MEAANNNFSGKFAALGLTRVNYPINYDFGKNWSKIIPFLDHPNILTAIKKGINAFCKNFSKREERYVPQAVPASYSSGDYYECTLMNRKRELKLEELKASGQLPKKFLELQFKLCNHNYDEYRDDDSDSDDSDDEENIDRDESDRMYTEIMDLYFHWNILKYELESYYVGGSCHFWAPTFELELAKLVEPNEKWIVRKGKKHTTIINENCSKVFDLLYWCSSPSINRLENYVFGDPFNDDDITLGGKLAYLDSEKE